MILEREQSEYFWANKVIKRSRSRYKKQINVSIFPRNTWQYLSSILFQYNTFAPKKLKNCDVIPLNKNYIKENLADWLSGFRKLNTCGTTPLINCLRKIWKGTWLDENIISVIYGSLKSLSYYRPQFVVRESQPFNA